MRNFINLLLCGLTLFIGSNCSGQIAPKMLPLFEKYVLCDSFLSEGVAVADINNDGHLDIIAGAYWFEAPTWKAHELAEPQPFVYDQGYSNAFLHFALDVDQDGWMDIIRVDLPGEAVVWHQNNRNGGDHWKEHLIYPAFGNENPLFIDMNGDGRPDLVGNDPEAEEVIWLEAPSEPGNTSWKKHVISKEPGRGTHRFTHGLGVADMNGDKRLDVLITTGWWEAPEYPNGEPWLFHSVDFGEDCAQMQVIDVNGDGLLDVVSSSAHNYGIWWHEQKAGGADGTYWVKHVIDRAFSQSHALVLKDINGDGNRDLVTGKRFFAHNGHDPGAFEPAVLNWYEYLPGESPYWRKHEIDNDSGVGLQLVVEDVDGDGLQDVVVSNKKGVFYFRQSVKR